MNMFIKLFLLATLSSSVHGAADGTTDNGAAGLDDAAAVLRSRQLNNGCAPFMGCYLRNLDSGKEFELKPGGSGSPNAFSVVGMVKGYNVHCEVSTELGSLDSYKFTYNGQSVSQAGLSGWLDGISSRTTSINACSLLGSCGEKKFKAQGYRAGSVCFEYDYSITAPCPPTKAPTKAPVKAPTKSPTRAPVKTTKAPTKAPVKAPTKSPTRRPTSAPVITCQNGWKVMEGKCYPNSCAAVFKCPEFSTAKNADCTASMNDCQCIQGYMRGSGNDSNKCIRDPNTCIEGWKMMHGRCAPNGCDGKGYLCPANSFFRLDRNCLDTFEDCECNAPDYRRSDNGTTCEANPCKDVRLKMRNGRCQPTGCTSDFVCPVNSRIKPSRDKECLTSVWNDCDCFANFTVTDDGKACEPNPCPQGRKPSPSGDGRCVNRDCWGSWKCPVNSTVHPNNVKDCYLNMNQCVCGSGFRKSDDGSGCEPNPCGNGMKLRDGRCIPEGCTSSYKCPSNSKVKTENKNDCISNIGHCECNDGFRREGDVCVVNPCVKGQKPSPSGDGRCVPENCGSSYRCPKLATVVPSRNNTCFDGFSSNCVCGPGFKEMGGRCVPTTCTTNFNCGSNAKVRDENICCSGMADCTCDNGFKAGTDRCYQCGNGRKILNNQCVPEGCNGTFQCPSNSFRKTDRDCFTSMNDCRCNDRFKVEGDKCVDDPNWCPDGKKMINGFCCSQSCTANYQCPANSKINTARDCIASIADCICNTGFTPSGNACVPDPCTAANSNQKTMVDGRCGPGWCTKTYKCPANSKVDDGKENDCIDNIWDCTCDANYVRIASEDRCHYNPCGSNKMLSLSGDGRCVGDWCKQTFKCPANSKISNDADGCPHNINGCKCDEKYVSDWPTQSCIYLPCGSGKKEMDGRCVPSSCTSTFKCGPNSKIKPSEMDNCLTKSSQCVCDDKYEMTDGVCVSNPCGPGKKLIDGRCVPANCASTYRCPENSKIQPGKENACLNGPEDCECNDRHEMINAQCVFNPCGIGMKDLDGRCVPDWCESRYKCNNKAKIQVGKENLCITGPWDCVCEPGFKMEGDNCVRDFAPCPNGKVMVNGRCQSETCPVNNYVCPMYSRVDTSKDCISSFDDCVCNGGFIRIGGQCVFHGVCPSGTINSNGQCVSNCVNTFTCPANSYTTKNGCITSINDCTCSAGFQMVSGQCVAEPCSTGFKMLGDRCIPNTCTSTFTCGPNSKVALGRERACITSMQDCTCDSGYRMNIAGTACESNPCSDGFKPFGKRCIPEICHSQFICPLNSKPKKGKEQDCLNSIKDCDCDLGYRMQGNQCVVNDCGDGFKSVFGRCVPEDCATPFTCPLNSKPIKSKERDCSFDIKDCQCDSGFRLENNICVVNQCGDGFKPLGDRCVPVDCSSTFTCPLNSKPAQGKELQCITDIKDCQCNSNYRLENGVCVANLCGDGMKKQGDRCVPESCTSTFTCSGNFVVVKGKEKDCLTDMRDCVCKAGFRMENNACVENKCGEGMKPMGDRCVPDTCSSTFTCGPNSRVAPGLEQSCIASSSDCVCNSGYRMEQGVCVTNSCPDGMVKNGDRCQPDWCRSTYKCPTKAKVVESKKNGCITGVWDCECESGFRLENGVCVVNTCGDNMKLVDGRCVPEYCSSTYRCPTFSKIKAGKEKACINNIFDCSCDAGFKLVGEACVPETACSAGTKLVDGRCIPDSCTSTYKCPANSSIAKGREKDCLTSIADCECLTGFRKVDNACVPNTCSNGMIPMGPENKCLPEWCKTPTFKCPANSKVAPGREADCLSSVADDCVCNTDHVMVNNECVHNPCGVGRKSMDGRCVPEYCTSTFKCGPNSKIAPGKERECLTGVFDCVCNSGFRWDKDVCVPNNCGDGFKPMGADGRCVPDSCNSAFSCPLNSKIANGKEKDCLHSVWDCVCQEGYRMSGGACVVNTCANGMKLLEGKCVPDWCTSSYSCPANSQALPGKACLQNKLDCTCNVGFTMVGDVCVADPCGAGKKMLSGKCVPIACNTSFTCPVNAKALKNCPASIVDCACDSGFRLEGDKCVTSNTPKTCSCNCAMTASGIMNDTCLAAGEDPRGAVTALPSPKSDDPRLLPPVAPPVPIAAPTGGTITRSGGAPTTAQRSSGAVGPTTSTRGGNSVSIPAAPKAAPVAPVKAPVPVPVAAQGGTVSGYQEK